MDLLRLTFGTSIGPFGIPARQDRYRRGLSGGVGGVVGVADLVCHGGGDLDGEADAVVEGAADLGRLRPASDRYADGVSVVLLGLQECEGVADALFEELVG